jgi:hypothetical protein
MTRKPHRAPGFMLRIAALLAGLGGTLAAGFAQAQPGALFGDGPPRPPANVPNGSLPPQPPPVQFPGQSTLAPPQAGPPPSGIQAQPLPPPPGAILAPPNQAQRARVAPPSAGAPAPQPAGPSPPQPADTASQPPPDDTVITEMPTQKIENTRAVFAGLDKITGRIISFDAAVGETVQFGALQVTARVCYTRPPTEATNTDAFVEVDEVTLQGEIKRIFNGWMFAASPGLHGVEHPIYDVWLTDCGGPAQARVAEPPIQPTPAAATTAARPPSPRPRQAVPRAQAAPPVAPAPAPLTPLQPR